MSKKSDYLRRQIGSWWWVRSAYGMAGPMSYRRAQRWAIDCPYPNIIVWRRP